MNPLTIPTVDLAALIGRDVPLHRESRSELSGPCVKCGGRDRLHVNTAKGWWFCRRCSPKPGDAAGWLMWKDGLRFPEAVARLEGMGTVGPVRRESVPDLTEAQRATFGAIASECAWNLVNDGSGRARSWLEGRGMDIDTIESWSLGHNPGLPGATTAMHGCRVPCGVTIPLHGVDGRIHGISVRRAAAPKGWDAARGGRWRYQAVAGTQVPLFGREPRHRYCLIVEGYFDAMLLDRLLGDSLDVAALGTAKENVDGRWFDYLRRHALWLICLDNDDAGRAAAKGWNWSDRARVIQQPEGCKDPSEAWQRIAAKDGPAAADEALTGWLVCAALEAGCQ